MRTKTRTKTIRLIVLILWMGLCQKSNAQSDISGYLKSYDTASINKKIQLFHYFYNQLGQLRDDTLMYYINDLRRLGVKNERRDAIAMADYGMIPYLQENALHDQAINRLSSALAYYKTVQNDSMLSGVYNAFGVTYYLQGNYIEAEVYYKKSMQVAQSPYVQDYRQQAIYNLSILYINEGKYIQAGQLLDGYIAYMDSVENKKKLASAYGMLGQLHLNENKIDLAISNFNESINYGLSTQKLSLIANSYTNMGIAEYLSENYLRAESYFRLALKYRKKKGISKKVSEAYYNLGDLFYGLENLDSAIVNYQTALFFSKEAKDLVGQKDALTQLAIVYATQKQLPKQIEVLEQIIQLQKEINKQQSDKKMAALIANFNQKSITLKDKGAKREQKLYSQIFDYQSLFNRWLLVLIAVIVGALTITYVLKKKQKNRMSD